MPWRVGTNGNNQSRICQSPRIHRCWRRACASTLDGYSSTSSTSDTSATRACRPSNRSCDSSAFSGTESSSDGDERVDVVESLAGEDAFAEHVLVGVGHRRRVRVDAGVARIEPREQRAGGARERDADARLEDAVALGDAADRRIERRPIQRMA